MVKRISGAGGGPSGTGSNSDAFKANSFYRGVYLISQGPIEPVDDLDKAIYLNDVPLKDNAGESNFEGVARDIRYGTADQTNIPGQDSVYSTAVVNQQVEQGSPHAVTIAGDYDAVTVTVSFPGGLYRVQDDGDYKNWSVNYAIDIQSNGSSTWVPVHNITRDIKQITPFDETLRVDLPVGAGPWQVRVRRVSEDAPNNNYIGETYFKNYATVVDGKFSYPYIAHLGLQVNAREFGNSIPKVSYLGKGLKIWIPKNYDPVTRTYATSGIGTSGGIWDGTFKSAYSNNPAWVYYDVLVNNRYGLGQYINPSNDLGDALADKWNLYTIAQYCDGLVSDGYGGQEPRFTLNAYITEEKSAFDFMRMLASAFRGIVYWASNSVFTLADIPGSPEVHFNQTDVEDGLFNYSGSALSTRSTCVLVKYRDKRNLYKQEVEVIEDYSAIYELGYREKAIDGFGVTSRGLARRLGKWLLLTEKFQTQIVNFTTGLKGATVFPGMIINISDSYKAGLRAAGRIMNVVDESGHTTITVDSDVTLSEDVEYTVKCTLPDGTNLSATVTNDPGTYRELTVATIATHPIVGAVWTLSSSTLAPKRFRVLSVKQDKNKYAITALEEYSDKYSLIEEGPEFEEAPTSVISTDQVLPPTNLAYVQWYSPVSGSEVRPQLTVSWTPPEDNRVNRFELQIRTNTQGYTTVYKGDQTTWDSGTLNITGDNEYQVRVRSISIIGTVSPWAESDEFTVVGKAEAPPVPSNINADGIINGVAVSWDNATVSDFKHTEVWGGNTNVLDSATLLAEISDDFYIDDNVNSGQIRYYWLRTVSHALTDNISDYSTPVNGTSRFVGSGDIDDAAITVAKFASGITPVEIVTSLPVVNNFVGRTVYLTTDGKLYRYTGTGFVATVATVDLIGTVVTAQIADGAINTAKFASGIAPIEILAALPVTGNYAGRQVFLTTDSKLYRYNGTSFVSTVPSTDITGTLADAQIAAVAASKVTGQLTNSQLADIAAAKVTGTLSDSQIAALSASKLTGQITTTQITDGAISTAKVAAGAITAAEIAADTITAGNIAANAITATELAAGAVTAGKIAAGSIVAADIASGTITATQLAAGSVTAGKIAAGTIVAADIASDTITAGQIAANAITSNELAANSVIAGKVQAGAISTTELAANAVTTAKLAAGAVTANEIAANTITAANIAADSITSNEIAANAITSNELSANSVIAGKVAAAAISTTELAANAVTAAKIAANTITAAQIAAGTITATELATGSVTAGKISVTDLSSINANIGTVTAGVVQNSTGSSKFDLNNGTIIFNNGSFMKVSGIGFGTSSQFLEWTGPTMSISLCSESNASTYLKTNGDVFFGGVLKANTVTTSMIANNSITNPISSYISTSYAMQNQVSIPNFASRTAPTSGTTAGGLPYKDFDGGNTPPAVYYSGASSGFSDYYTRAPAYVTITSTGGKITLSAAIGFDLNTAGFIRMNIQRVGGSTPDTGTYVYSAASSKGSAIAHYMNVTFEDTPAAGTYTYSIWVYENATTGTNNMVHSYMCATEVKK